MRSGNSRARRLLMWALRLSSPSKACAIAAQRIRFDPETMTFTRLEIRPHEGLLTLREAWTGELEPDEVPA